ncbi:MAG: glycosyltransferase family 4 protein [Candidatus Hydrogenedentes bacterium]|nr:glycosyltransferase family 4 protein [Candidatus Hydrogenedentota bacterium]
MSLRIAMVGACAYPVPQGSQVFMRDTALMLHRRGHDVHLVVYGYGVGRDYSGLRVHRCWRLPGDQRTAAGPAVVKPLLDLALVFTLRRIIREHHIDVVCAHNYEGLLVALAAGKRPIVYHAHNAMSDELPYYFRYKRAAERLGRWLDHTFPHRADRVIAPHPRLAGHLIVRGCDHARVSVVPPPLDVNLFDVCRVDKAVPPVLYAGNLDAYQNLGLLFAAMERVRRLLPEARLHIATAEKDAEIPQAEIISTLGFDSLQRVLAQDAVFAVPRVSWSGFPIKLLNAMAAGMAIVACQSAAYPLTDGENGLVVADDDPQAFAEALLSLLTTPNLRRELGQRARETIARDHQPEKTAEKLEAVFGELLGTEP